MSKIIQLGGFLFTDVITGNPLMLRAKWLFSLKKEKESKKNTGVKNKKVVAFLQMQDLA